MYVYTNYIHVYGSRRVYGGRKLYIGGQPQFVYKINRRKTRHKKGVSK